MCPEAEKKLEIQSLVKSYRKRRVVNGVSLDVHSGEVVGLLGPNGAGKTTTFYMVLGLTRPDKGTIRLNGKNITRLPMYKRARLGISYLPQEASVFRKLTVKENILAILETLSLRKVEREERLEKLLNELNIAHLSNNVASTLSGGERRRLEITRALVSEPSFILLDEPFAGIDPIAVMDIQEIVGQLKQHNIGVLITDHNVRETLEITDRAYIINAGQIFASGDPKSIAESPEVKKFYLGDKFKL